MKSLIYIIFFVFLSQSIKGIAFAGPKIADKVFGTRDCSQYNTKNFAGLNDYVRCKKGMEISDKSFFKSFKIRKKDSKKFDLNKPCHEYNTKTITGLTSKFKCKSMKKI